MNGHISDYVIIKFIILYWQANTSMSGSTNKLIGVITKDGKYLKSINKNYYLMLIRVCESYDGWLSIALWVK